MHRRIKITKELQDEIWEGRDKKFGDYFIMTTASGSGDSFDMLIWDIIKETKSFNKQMANVFNTKFFPLD